MMKTDDRRPRVDFLRLNSKEIIIRTTREDGQVVNIVARVIPPEKKASRTLQAVTTGR